MTEERVRLSVIDSLRPPPKRPQSAPPSTKPATEASVADPVGRPVKPAKPKKASSRSTGGTRAISFSTPGELADRLREAARNDSDQTIAGTLLAIVEKQAPNLGAHIDAERKRTSPAPSADDSIFPVAMGRQQPTSSPSVVKIVLPAANVDVLDDLVGRHKADSRSQLLTAALRAHFAVLDA